MNTKPSILRRYVAISFAAFCCTACIFGQTAMQDDWSYYGFRIQGAFKGGTVAPNGNLYMCAGTSVKIYSPNGTYLGERIGFADLRGCAVAEDGTLFAFDLGSTSKIIKISEAGQEILRFGATGTGAGQFSSSTNQIFDSHRQFVALDEDQNVYAVDPNNYRVNVFTAEGVFVQSIGSSGSLPGQFKSQPISLVVEPGGSVVVATRGQNTLMSFTKNGVYEQNLPGVSGVTNLSTLPDNLNVINFSGGSDRFEFKISDKNGFVFDFSTGYVAGSGWRSDGIMASANGDIWCITGSDVRLFKRKYSPADTSLEPPSIPQPVVLSFSQRPNTALMDIDYRVTDVDSATVTTAVLAFKDNGTSLSDIIPVNTLVEGTEANLGADQPTGQVRRLTWNVGADQPASFVSLNAEVYAKDERGLYPFRWITLPDGIGGSGSLTVSARPLTDSDLFQIWFWLVATKDVGVELRSDGKVFGATGGYANQELASGSGTVTASGRAYLLERLGVRAITDEELARSQGGNFNFESLSTDSVVKLP